MNVVVASVSPTRVMRRTVGNRTLKHLNDQLKLMRSRRGIACSSYGDFRYNRDKYDQTSRRRRRPSTTRTATRPSGTCIAHRAPADALSRRYFEVFRGTKMVLISHRSGIKKLKRIKAQPVGEKMRVLWSGA